MSTPPSTALSRHKLRHIAVMRVFHNHHHKSLEKEKIKKQHK